jgi:hypothetical protein
VIEWDNLSKLSWDDMAHAINNGPFFFEMSRVPPDLPWHVSIEHWTDVDVDTFYDWILVHQRRLHAGEVEAEQTAFQFIKEGQAEPFRRDGRLLEYEEDAAFYYMATQRFQFSDDVYRPLSVASARCFTAEFIQEWQNFLPPSAVKLLENVDRQQLHNPPNVSRLIHCTKIIDWLVAPREII